MGYWATQELVKYISLGRLLNSDDAQIRDPGSERMQVTKFTT